MEKLVLILTYTTHRLKPYFQAHPIKVLIDLPLRSTMHSIDVSGRMMKYSCKLGAFGIQYVPRTDVKAQVLPDFLYELTGPELTDSRSLFPDFMLEGEEWITHIDGSKTQFGGGARIVL